MSKLPSHISIDPPDIDVVAAGHICLDVIPTLLSPSFQYIPGRLVEAGAVVTSTGGSVSNTGLSLHRLGVVVHLMGKVGGDLFGDAVRNVLDSYGVGLSCGLVTSPGEQTSYSIIISPPGSDRMFLHAPGCNATFNEDDVDEHVLERSKLFHFGYPPLMQRTFADGGVTLKRILQKAKNAGATTSLDMSMPDLTGPAGKVNWSEILTRIMPFVDICTPSVEEILQMLRPDLYDSVNRSGVADHLIDNIDTGLIVSLGDQLLQMGAKVAFIKLGHRGAYLQTGNLDQIKSMGRGAPSSLAGWSNRQLWAPCFRVDVVGTTGSGDATSAGFLMGLIRGMSPEASMNAACAVGACSVEAADSLSGVQSWPHTLRRIQAGWAQRDLAEIGTGWTWCEELLLWAGPDDQGGRSQVKGGLSND